MNTIPHQKLSQFLDNDLTSDEALTLLQTLRQNEDARATLGRYAVISHAIKTREICNTRADFVASVAERLDKDPVYFLPARKSKSLISRNDKLIAVAASIAVVAVLAAGNLRNQPSSSMLRPASIIAQQRSNHPEKLLALAPVRQTQSSHPLNKRIQDYLQAHDSSVYADTRSIASVTAYHQK